MTIRALLDQTAGLAADYLEALPERPAGWLADVEELRSRLGGPLPETPDRSAGGDRRAGRRRWSRGWWRARAGATSALSSAATAPAAIAADWLTSVWDQNAGLYVCCPSSAVVEEVAGAWLAELLGLPAGVGFGLVTGCQMAHVTALAAARHSVFARVGWDVGERGLIGAPRGPRPGRRGAPRHRRPRAAAARLRHRLRDADRGRRAGPDASRARCARRSRAGDGPAIVCAQAGNVNTGAFDPLEEIADIAQEAGAWLHIDGAFGLWAAASPAHRHLVAGAERADSWAVDAHKWLNVPYDSGIAFCAHPEAQQAAMGVRASYLIHADPGGPRDAAGVESGVLAPRTRAFPIYAAIRSLGPLGDRRADRALLRPRPPLRRGAERGPGRRGAQRRGAQPGARALPRRGRRPRCPHRRGDRGRPERRHLLAERHDLAGHARHAHLGVEPGHDRPTTWTGQSRRSSAPRGGGWVAELRRWLGSNLEFVSNRVLARACVVWPMPHMDSAENLEGVWRSGAESRYAGEGSPARDRRRPLRRGRTRTACPARPVSGAASETGRRPIPRR